MKPKFVVVEDNYSMVTFLSNVNERIKEGYKVINVTNLHGIVQAWMVKR